MKKSLFLFVLYGVVLLNCFSQNNDLVRARISSINEKIMDGKKDLNAGNIDSALNNFNDAVSQLSLSEGSPFFWGSKYSEVASALFEASLTEKDPSRKAKLNREALSYVNQALNNNPNDPVSHYILGMNYIDSRDWEKAAKELGEAVKSAPKNYMYYYQLGRAQYRLKNYTDARSAFENSIKCNNKFDLSYYNLGMTLRCLKLNKDALAAFINAHNVNSQNSKAYLEEARVLNEAYNDKNGAINCYNQVISLDPVNRAALNECGVVYSSQGNYVKAESCHRKAVALLQPGDKDPITYYNLALCLYQQKKYADAEKYAKLSYEQKDVIKNDKAKADIIYNYGLIEEAMKNEARAIELYKEVLALDPDNTKTMTNLGVMFMAMNPPNADEALKFFLDAYKVEKSFELENNLGCAYLAKKDYTNAITHFQNALKKSPKDQAVRFNLAKCYAVAGDYNNAKTCYVNIINADQTNYDSYIDLAKVFVALKDTASAKSYLDVLRQKNPAYRKSEVDSLLTVMKDLKKMKKYVPSFESRATIAQSVEPDEEDGRNGVDNASEAIVYEEMVNKSNNDFIDPEIAYYKKDSITDVTEKSLVVFNYASKEDQMGHFAKAYDLYKEALLLDPQNFKAKAKLGILLVKANPIYADAMENDLSNACIELVNVCNSQNDVLGADIYFNALKEINSTYENSKVEDVLDVSSNSNIKDGFYDKEKLGDKIYKEIHLSKNSTISKWVVYSSVDRYDIFGNVIYSKNDSGETVLYNCEYDKKGSLVHCKSNGSTVEEFWNEYDENGKLIHKKYASGNESWYKYDRSGNQIYEKNDKGDEYFYEYVSDEYWGDYLSRVKGSDGSESYIEYDHTREGYKKHVKSRVNNVNLDVLSEYDSSDHLIHTVFGLGELWYEYEFYPDGTIKTRRTYKTL